jgi:hypothetical protein
MLKPDFTWFGAVSKWLSLALALYILNFALSFHNIWPTLWITSHHELSIEIAIILLALAIYSRRRQGVSPRLLTVLASILTLLTIGRYAEVTAPALYGRPVNIYWDARFLPHVAEMLAEAAHPVLVIGLFIGILLIIATLFVILLSALSRVAAGGTNQFEFRVVTGLAGMLVVAYLSGFLGLPLKKPDLYSLPVTHTLWQQVGFITAAVGADARLDPMTKQDPLGKYPLPKLGGADVVVHFVESYGAVAFDNESIAQTIAKSRADLAQAIQETNRRVVSAYLVSPTFGGGSWLAHSSFMTGLDINDNGIYNLLLTREQASLSTRFTALGYRSIALMPGLRSEWPEGIFYRFASIYGAREIEYSGPEFGWWRIPDQYSLARLAELELGKVNRDPLFIMFTTISSHMPFRPTPPYQPEWSRILTDQPYDQTELEEALSLLPDWTNMQPAYAGTLNYTFNYLGGFLREQADLDVVWIVIGDHQPASSVSGEGVRWDVPVHIISANNQIIEDLIDNGFVEGLTPIGKPLGPMYLLPSTLLQGWSDQADF